MRRNPAKFFNASIDTNRKTIYTPPTGSKVQPTNNQQGAMTMSGKYYAVADANGPISVRIYADSAAHAAAWFDAQETNFVDAGRTDAEDDLDIEGDGMEPAEFAEALKSRGWSPIYSDICGDGQWSLYTKV